MEGYRFLHISDLHLSAPSEILIDQKSNSPAKKGRDTWQKYCLQETGRYIDIHSDSLDSVIITGDISDDGCSVNLEYAKNYLHKHGPFIGSSPTDKLVASSTTPVCMSPGNHDRFSCPKAPFRALYEPGSRNFENTFGKHWRINNTHSHSSAYSEYVNSFITSPNSKNPVVVTQADFSLLKKTDAPLGLHWGMGKAYSYRLAALVNETKRIRAENHNTVVIWIIHFPVITKNVSSLLLLIEREKVRQAAINCKIDLILSGHTHASDIQRLNKSKHFPINIIAGSATASSADESYISKGMFDEDDDLELGPQSFLDISFEHDGGQIRSLSVKEFLWHRQQSCFVNSCVVDIP